MLYTTPSATSVLSSVTLYTLESILKKSTGLLDEVFIVAAKMSRYIFLQNALYEKEINISCGLKSLAAGFKSIQLFCVNNRIKKFGVHFSLFFF